MFKPDPMGEPRNAFQVYILLLAIVSSLGTLSGVPTAGFEAIVPFSYRVTWALMLLLGSCATLLGMYWQGDARTGLVMKRFGLFVLMIASFIYGSALLIRFGVAAMLVAFIIYGFSAAAGQHFYRVNKRIRRAVQESV